jgi:hypothetical protein
MDAVAADLRRLLTEDTSLALIFPGLRRLYAVPTLNRRIFERLLKVANVAAPASSSDGVTVQASLPTLSDDYVSDAGLTDYLSLVDASLQHEALPDGEAPLGSGEKRMLAIELASFSRACRTAMPAPPVLVQQPVAPAPAAPPSRVLSRAEYDELSRGFTNLYGTPPLLGYLATNVSLGALKAAFLDSGGAYPVSGTHVGFRRFGESREGYSEVIVQSIRLDPTTGGLSSTEAESPLVDLRSAKIIEAIVRKVYNLLFVICDLSVPEGKRHAGYGSVRGTSFNISLDGVQRFVQLMQAQLSTGVTGERLLVAINSFENDMHALTNTSGENLTVAAALERQLPFLKIQLASFAAVITPTPAPTPTKAAPNTVDRAEEVLGQILASVQKLPSQGSADGQSAKKTGKGSARKRKHEGDAGYFKALPGGNSDNPTACKNTRCKKGDVCFRNHSEKE